MCIRVITIFDMTKIVFVEVMEDVTVFRFVHGRKKKGCFIFVGNPCGKSGKRGSLCRWVGMWMGG